MTTIKTPLPEKFTGEWDEDSFGGRVNQLIDYLAELTKVVEGKQAPINQQRKKYWRAEVGELYWYVSDWGDTFQNNDFRGREDTFRHNIGNYFETFAEAKTYREQLLDTVFNKTETK